MDMFFAAVSAVSVLLFPLVSGYMTGEVLAKWNDDTWNRLLIAAAVLVLLTAVKVISNIIYAYFGHAMGAKMEETMRRELFEHYESLSFSFHARNSTGKLMTVLSNDLTNMTELFHHAPEDLLMTLIKFIGAFVIMFSINIPLTLIVFFALPFLAVAAYYTDKKMEKYLLKNKKYLSEMNEYAEKGYWPKDVMSSQIYTKDNFNNGMSAAYIAHQPDWTGNYGALKQNLPEAKTDYWCFPEANGKIQRTAPLSNATVINAKSQSVEKSLKFLEKIMTDEAYYRLMQYGIEGRQYEIVDGLAQQPASYNIDVDGGGFAAWANRVDKFNIPYATEDPRRYTLNEEWEKVAIDNPYLGFQFDPKNITTEQSAISAVNSQLGVQIMLGKTGMDPKEAVAQYRQQLKDAGIEKVIAEVKAQLEDFTPIVGK